MIPWDRMVDDGVVTLDQACELATVIQQHDNGCWSFAGYPALPAELREACERVVLAVCCSTQVVQ